MPTHHHALNSGSLLHNVYRIQSVLGSGTFGITYLAIHVNLGSQSVIKEYLPEFATRRNGVVQPSSSDKADVFQWGLNGFFNEAKTLHRLSHPNIVKVSDLFEENGTAYFVMPYMGSTTLLDWIKQHPKPTTTQLQNIFLPLLDGLAYIHEQNLLHRDIKPANILLTENNVPVLIDFGSARFKVDTTKPVTQLLTPNFAPIEQYGTQSQQHTPALDIYSLSACLYQAITGTLPHAAPDRINQDTLPKLAHSTQHAKNHSAQWLAAIDKGLNVQARDRFPTARAMYDALSSTATSSAPATHLVAPATTLSNPPPQTVYVNKTAASPKSPHVPAAKQKANSSFSGSLKKFLKTLMAICVLILLIAGAIFAVMWYQKNTSKANPNKPYRDTVRLKMGDSMATYTGWLKNGIAEDNTGTAKLKMDDGTECTVSMHNNQRTGKGKCVYPKGSVYEGEWLNDEKHGFGKYTLPSTSPMASYEGQFANGKLSGSGNIIYRNGATFTGEFANDNIKTKSKGAITGMLHMSSLCEGTFTSSTANCAFRQGKAVIQYKGGHKNGLWHGDGTVIMLDAGVETDRYRAKFRDGEIEGDLIRDEQKTDNPPATEPQTPADPERPRNNTSSGKRDDDIKYLF